MPGFIKFADSLEYISQNVSAALAIALLDRLRAAPGNVDGAIDAVMNDVSTSGAGVFIRNGAARRRALRSLILCQRVFLSELYLNASMLPNIPGGFPGATISHWSSKSENEMIRGIEMYARRANADGADLRAAAQNGPVHNLQIEGIVHKVTRESDPFPVDPTCYRAVQSWLLKSGFITLQWYLKNIIANVVVGGAQQNRGADLLGIFGPGQAIDVSQDGGIPAVPAGQFIYLYKANADGGPNIFGALGHWMVSDGNGMGFGCNNAQDAADHPANLYARCSIPNQVRAMRPEGGPLRTFLRIYDPAGLPA